MFGGTWESTGTRRHEPVDRTNSRKERLVTMNVAQRASKDGMSSDLHSHLPDLTAVPLDQVPFADASAFSPAVQCVLAEADAGTGQLTGYDGSTRGVNVVGAAGSGS